ncbi:TRF2-interacting telomeric protein/Rap1 C terminal domain-containing protein [Annulohypoxylon truncatum]|uniref:TRF2-interacting telomeric protein/Rap1 C terminal domain-containing protein n=1 Tax=Annulohypoxylon truncatum TaxID=327061 RepID=UPI002008D53B|nr:TRF2-interacting telomeric protein/Rap1 C terminal domain-containing protein [Annulohypoxylon truncatum]KAI1211211.1 TRF2-interacting telomeric protein/Rap1 C terminal domain-containing protein [Annulohypoxylon truncatum]
MAAPIVYEGALAPKEHLQNGLFKNIKFWVAQRVPMRLTWIQNIQDNGGKVIQLEKDADMLIADHLKKNNPPGSYSYEWIRDSLKAGALQPREGYLCAPAKQSKPTSSAVPRKGTRAAFTPEDDKILTNWVMKKELEGESLSGLQIYKELEEKHSNHTYQSWQARWVKKLQYLPRPELIDEEPPTPPNKQTAEHYAPSSPSIPRTPAPPRVGQRPTRNPTSRSPRTRAKFTEEDDRILIQHIQQCVLHNKAIKGITIFRDLANDFPQHTEQSWRDRWVKQLAPKYEDDIVHWRSETTREETPEIQTSPVQETTNITTNTPQKLHTRGKEPAQSVISRGDDEVGDEGASLERDSPSEFQARPEAPTDEPSDASSDMDQSFTGEFTTKEEFRRCYKTFMEAQDHIFVPFLTIKGITFEPWDLWEAVASQKMEPEERDWQQIAEKLGFNWVQHENVHDELRVCYEKHLSLFEEFWKNYQEEEEEEEEEEVEDEEDQDLEEHLPSSPPVISSLKRSLDARQVSSDYAYPQSSPKRRRLNKNAEIPSTPDHVNGTSSLRHQPAVEVTPSARRSAQRFADGGDEEDESRDTLNELPAIRGVRKKVLEPETQDFRFDPETQNIMFDTQGDMEIESQFSITPSQQLRQESDAVSPDIANASPTPKARNRNATQGSPTPRRSIRNPFQEDSEGETSAPATDSHIDEATKNTAAAGKAKRRSLPESFSLKPSPTVNSTSVRLRTQAQSHSPESPRPAHRPIPAKETPDDVIDRFCSLGYPRNIVLLALRATTWRLGDAGQVMEMLKRGEELPQRTHGVWTQRDDDALKLVTSDEPPKDEKEKRKRARMQKRLEEKHGPELMELRYKYLWGVV